MRKSNSGTSVLGALFKMAGEIFRHLFQPATSRDFKRLKDFIAS